MESLRDSTRSTSISVASVFMRHVYQWMTGSACLVTAGTAFFVASSPALLSAIFGNTFGLIILAIAVFAMPLVLSGMISRLSAFAATALFVVYSALMGAFPVLGTACVYGRFRHVHVRHLRGHVRRNEHLRHRHQT